MKVIKTYSFKKGKEFLEKNHPKELEEVLLAIKDADASSCMSKVSEEKTMTGKLLFSPIVFNYKMKTYLHRFGWTQKSDSKKKFKEPRLYFGRRFREMDGVKNRVGLEIQFGKYAFMGYDIFSKMVIFKNKGEINCGIEVVATQEIISKMSTGVSGFEQIMIDFENRGEADIDIPVLVLGIGLTDKEKTECGEREREFNKNQKSMLKDGRIFRPNTKTKPGPK